MKTLFTLSICLMINLMSFSQLNVQFEKAVENISAESDKMTSYTFTLKATPQPAYDGYSVEFELLPSDFAIKESNIFLPVDRNITISGTKDVTKKFTIQFKEDKIDIKTIKFGLKEATKKGQKNVQLAPSFTSHILKIKNKPDGLDDNEGYEFWLYTGTNIDLLDGVKPKDLYFKASYLVNIKKRNINNIKVPSRSWWYINFGKNRYFTEKDTLTRRGFTDVIPNNGMDSTMQVINGRYHANLQTEINNIYFFFNYLYNIDKYSSEKSKLLIGAGLYVGLQNIETRYKDVNVYFRDTTTVPFDPNFTFRPIPFEFKREELNTNYNFTLVHILNTNKINVKTQFTTGLHYTNFPYATPLEKSSSPDLLMANNGKLFIQARIDATVLSPGISIGFEGFLRQGAVPLFNASFTKVIDLQNLKSIFAPVKAATLGK